MQNLSDRHYNIRQTLSQQNKMVKNELQRNGNKNHTNTFATNKLSHVEKKLNMKNIRDDNRRAIIVNHLYSFGQL